MEGHPHRWRAWVLTAFAVGALWLAPATLGSSAGVTTRGDAPPSAIDPNQQLIGFLRSAVGVATEVIVLGLGALAWTVAVARWLRQMESTDRIPATKSARKRARRRDAIQPEPVSATVFRVLVGLVTAAALILPITFSIVIGADVFALPKTVALWAFGAAIPFAMITLIVAGARLSRPGILELSAIAYVGLTAIATFTSVDAALSVVGERLQYQGLISTVAYMLLFAAAAIALTTPIRIRILAVAMLASATVAAVYAVMQWFEIDPIWDVLYKGRVFSTVGQANALATTLAAGSIVALAIAPITGRARRIATIACAVLCVTGLVFTFSRGGYVAFALGLIVAGVMIAPEMGRFVDRRWAGRAFAGAGIAILLVGLLAVSWRPAGELIEQVASRTASIADASEGSNRAHLDLWNIGLQIAADHPIVGTGPDTYVLVFPDYRDVVLSPESAEKMARFRPESPHNVYLAIASGAGIPALVAFVVLVGGCLAVGIRAAYRAPLPTRIALAGLLGAVTVHLTTILFMTAEPGTFALMWILLGALAGLGRAGRALSPTLRKDATAAA